MRATYHRHILEFKRPSGTSRGVLHTKETWFITIYKDGKQGIGECGILRSLSIDDRADYEEKLQWTCAHIHLGVAKLWEALLEFPSIQFGVEMAFKSLASNDPYVLHPSLFTAHKDAISINGLIWMGAKDFMKSQINEKLAAGFHCIKLKIGAIDFEEEIALLAYIRSQFSKEVIEIRVDANGAFAVDDALDKLRRLSIFDLHSIEQPIRQGQIVAMQQLCSNTPLPIALDEELIGVFHTADKEALLTRIRPHYIILKPSLIGGYRGTNEWIAIAERLGIGWWITSALESNIGLNAIAQFTYTLASPMPQGLGTGGLYTNNIESPLYIDQGALYYNTTKQWESTIPSS